jgi:hypothetical protein
VTEDTITRYGFRQALSAYFLAEADALSGLLPSSLTPLTARPRHGVIAVSAFDFTESEVGAYGELVVSILVPPFALTSAELPQAAIFPIALCTTTPASRLHAAERWYLPAHDRCMDIQFEKNDEGQLVRVSDGEAPFLELRVGQTSTASSCRLYQCFSEHEEQIHRVDLRIEGGLDEHEEELGGLVLNDHPLVNHFAEAISDDIPLREQSMGEGEQRFETLVPHRPF